MAGAPLGQSAEPHAPPHGRGPSHAGALVDQRPLELGDAGEDGQHHPPGRAGGVGPGLAQRAKAGSSGTKQLGDLEEIAGRARQAVEPVHHDHVVLA
jgi:hypothetical protein